VTFVPKKLEQTADISTGNEGRLAFARNALFVVALLGVLSLVLGWMAEALVRQIPDAWEVDFVSLDVGEEVNPSGEDFRRGQRVFERLIASPELQKLKIQTGRFGSRRDPERICCAWWNRWNHACAAS
jgi:hypothetical protein